MGGRVDAFWSFLLGVQPSSDVNFFSFLSSIVVLSNEKAAECLLQACACRWLNQEDSEPSPALWFICLGSKAPATVLGT